MEKLLCTKSQQDQLEITTSAIKTLQNEMPDAMSVRVVQLSAQERYDGPLFPVEVGFYCDACEKSLKTVGSGNRKWNANQEPGAYAVLRHCKAARHKKKHSNWCRKTNDKPRFKAKVVDVGVKEPPFKRVRRETDVVPVATATADNKVGQIL